MRNPNQLVLRRDTRTGIAHVGWAAELPLGRFSHIELIFEADDCAPITAVSAHFALHQQACQKARALNVPLLAAQRERLLALGWLPVPLDLNDPCAGAAHDALGCYKAAAMRALYRLTANLTAVWVVVDGNDITQVQAREPRRAMERLEFEVWKHHRLSELARSPGDIRQGCLVVEDSGLWFRAEEA
jgi:hypothetical protein